MRFKPILTFSFYLLVIGTVKGQSLFETPGNSSGNRGFITAGFIRAGVYAALDQDNDIYLPASFSDLSIKLSAGNGLKYKAFVDVRFRYGAEFGFNVNKFRLNEGWVALYGNRFDIIAGKQIVKWGSTSIFDPSSKINARDDLYRSPDREDLDRGNMIIRLRFTPSEFVLLESAFLPYHTTSVMPVKAISLPGFIEIEESSSNPGNPEGFGYAQRAELHFKGTDLRFTWFNGYNPMPGIEYSDFNLLTIGPPVEAELILTEKPYRINMFSFEGERIIRKSAYRWTLLYVDPVESTGESGHIALPEISWIGGIDRSLGEWHLEFEYYGKKIMDYSPAAANPAFPGEEAIQLFPLMTPQEISSMVISQLGSFNRLYNYQLKEFYHSVAISMSKSGGVNLLKPEITGIYNFTTREILIVPSIKYNPADGIAIVLGGEYWQGPEDSLYDMIHKPLTGLFLSIRADF